MLHKKNVKTGFTLVELLAVIVILAIILVIAVPKIMDVINSSKKSTLETSVKMIASTAEKTKMQNTILGKEDATITCDSVAKLSSSDYESCTIKFDGNTAKVTVKGKGKFEGLSVCGGTKNSATAQEEDCPVPVSFANDPWPTIIAAVQSGDYPYNVGDTKEVNLGTLGTHTLRIANTTSCSEAFLNGTEGKSETACGFVLEFADVITEHNMNPSGEYDGTQYSNGWNKDGFPASSMYSYLNVVEGIEGSGTIYNALPSELRNAIIDTKVISSHGSKDTDNFTTKGVKLYLLSGEEIFEGFSSRYDTSIGTSKQLDYYKAQGVTTDSSTYSGAIKKLNGEAEWWWLRSAPSSIDNYFYGVYGTGGWGNSDAYISHGVSPAFRLAS